MGIPKYQSFRSLEIDVKAARSNCESSKEKST